MTELNCLYKIIGVEIGYTVLKINYLDAHFIVEFFLLLHFANIRNGNPKALIRKRNCLPFTLDRQPNFFFLIYLFIPTQVQNRQIILHIYININLLRLKHNNKLPRRHYFNTEHTYDPYLYLVVYVTLR